MEYTSCSRIRNATEKSRTVISPEVFREMMQSTSAQLYFWKKLGKRLDLELFRNAKSLDGIQFPATLKEIEEEAILSK